MSIELLAVAERKQLAVAEYIVAVLGPPAVAVAAAAVAVGASTRISCILLLLALNLHRMFDIVS